VYTGSPAGAGTTTGAGAGVTGFAGPAGVVGVTGTVGVGGSPGDGMTTAGVGVITVGAPGGGGAGSPQAAKGIAASITARHIKPSNVSFFKINTPFQDFFPCGSIYCQPIYHPLLQTSGISQSATTSSLKNILPLTFCQPVTSLARTCN